MLGFPSGSVVTGSIPGSGRSPETAAHSSMLAWRIPMDRGAWRATVHSVAKTEQVSMHSYVILMLQLTWKIAFKKKTKLQNQPRTEKLYHHLVSM